MNYEKHQRDYTVLATSIVFDEFFSRNMYKFFPFRPHKMYILIKNKILYHFIARADYNRWAKTWIENHNLQDLILYRKEIDNHLFKYRKFLKKKKYQDIISDIIKLNQYIRDFLPIIAIAAYVPMYGKNLDNEIKKLCLKTRKKYEDVHKTGIELQSRLLYNIEKEEKLPKDSLKYLTSKEFDKYISNGILPKNLNHRNKFTLVEQGYNYSSVFLNKKAKLLAQKITNKQNIITNKLTGQTAFSGEVKGTVRLVKLLREAQKIRKGEILVTAMTDPRYLQAMKKAGAIITNEGGITCHAAIVSRELKIPCIVGTKIATHVFNNGDLVEVNANHGWVRKIK